MNGREGERRGSGNETLHQRYLSDLVGVWQHVHLTMRGNKL